MGCCLSKNPPSKSEPQHENFPKSQKCGVAAPLAPPPPPPVEEETVKEVVLSETPIPKSPSPVGQIVNGSLKRPENQELKVEVPTPEVKPKEAPDVIKPAEDIISEVSEQSELCSFTESFSTTTTATAMEKRDDGEEVTQRSPVKYRRKRPNIGDIATAGRERNVRAPARRAVPSPEKRKPLTTSRPVQGRAMTVQRRNTGPPNGLRRNPSEGSARRSRSPLTRGEVGPRRNMRYKSPALGESGKPGGRSPARAVEDRGKVEKKNENVVPQSREMEKQNDDASPENGESIENPLVSLECFIFL